LFSPYCIDGSEELVGKMKDKRINMLHVCRKIYPSFRVDLTELFSKNFINYGHAVDWMMQSMDASDNVVIDVAERERIILGKSLKGGSPIRAAFNKCLTLLHDFRIVSQVLKSDYDIVQVRDKTFASLIGLLVCRIKKIKFVYWMSYTFVEADLISAQQSWEKDKYLKAAYLWARSKVTGFYLYKIIIPLADHTFVQSDRMELHVAKLGNFQNKLTTVPMGVSNDDLELKLEPKIDQKLAGKHAIVYLGTMIAIRRIDFFIRVLNEVIKQEPNAVLLLIGDGLPDDMQLLHDETKRLGLEDKVIFTGFIDRLEAWSYVKACRVGMAALPPNPVLDTCSPTKAVEYMALAVPSVVNDVGDQGTIVEQAEAGLVADYEPKAFADAVVKLIRDDALHADMAERGRPFVYANRSYDHLSEMLQAKYFEVLQ